MIVNGQTNGHAPPEVLPLPPSVRVQLLALARRLLPEGGELTVVIRSGSYRLVVTDSPSPDPAA
jgi:hypothetical protein